MCVCVLEKGKVNIVGGKGLKESEDQHISKLKYCVYI